MTMIDQLWIAAAAVLFIGLVAALAGFRPLPKTGRRCRRCGYDLEGIPESRYRCPECGGSLASGIVEFGDNEDAVRWRRRIRIAGVVLTGAAIAIGLAATLGDQRRLAWTPTWFLVRVDVPIGLRLEDDQRPDARGWWCEQVFGEITRRAESGSTVDLPLIEAVARPLVSRMEGPDRVGRGGRRFVLFAWGHGVVADDELAAIDDLWPITSVRVRDGPTVDGMDALIGVACPLDATWTWSDRRMRLEGLDIEISIGEAQARRRNGRSESNWPRNLNPNGFSGTGLLSSQFPLTLEPGEREMVVHRRYRLVAEFTDGSPSRTLGERVITCRHLLDVPPPPPDPTLVEDSERMSALAEALATSSWAERADDFLVRIMLAMKDPLDLDLGTPGFEIRLGTDEERVDEWLPIIGGPEDRLPQGPTWREARDARLGMGGLRRLGVRHPIHGGQVHEIFSEMPGVSPDDVDQADSIRVRLDTRHLNSRHWRRLVRQSGIDDPPATLPAGIVEFDVPLVDLD